MEIRDERPADYAAIHDLTRRAFAPMPYAAGNEQDLIDALREAGALALSLVVEGADGIIGHIAFSPAFAADGSTGWYALGPVSVDPAMQHRGIGRLMIETGIALLRERDAAGCVLVGNPDYYGRFGFQSYPELCPEGEPAQFFQILPLRTPHPSSVIAFHPLFAA